MSKVFCTPEEFRSWRNELGDRSVGFVPTMGALHAGHARLLQQAREENEICVLSIFVNPTQFNDKTDFEKYPTTWEDDLELAKSCGVDAVFAPVASALYPDDYTYRLTEQNFSRELCGQNRPGHFDGVLTVVMKLLQIVQPRRAYFGEKDFQQLNLIEGMVKAFFLPVEIVPVPTVREQDGLALSSRNVRLKPEERRQAPLIYRWLKEGPSAAEVREKLQAQGWKVDYVVDRGHRRFAAVHVGDVRLIDNVEI
jgi:pantoate--beta-alanine ligase